MSDHPPSYRLDAHAVDNGDESVREHLEGCERCRSYVAATGAEAASFAKHSDGPAFIARIQRKKKVVRVAFAVVPMLAAALVVFLVRPSPKSWPDVSSPPSSERFKGKVQLAVVRERDGEQKRVSTELAVRPGDRIRLEVAVDDARPIVAGLLGKDGSWVVLLTPSLLEAGTHFSDRSARFDDSPTEGWILAGDPEAVDQARASKDFAHIAAIAVVIER